MMLQRFKKFSKLSWNEQMLFSEALFLQLAMGLFLKIVPFKWIPKLFSNQLQETMYDKPGTRKPEHGKLNLIKAAIHHSSPYSPWKNKCLIQSLAARSMLNRRKIQSQLLIGVSKGANGRTIAHAWLKSDDFEVIEKSGDYRELYFF